MLIKPASPGRTTKMRLLRQLPLAIPLLLAALQPPLAYAEERDEALLTAVYLYNFAQFTTWPTPFQTLHLCSLGTDQVTEVLPHLEGRTLRGSELAITPLTPEEPLDHCQMLYIATSEEAQLADRLLRLQQQPTLTISQISGFAAQGGIIELHRQQKRIRFIINLQQARSVGLELSATLLRLATQVILEKRVILEKSEKEPQEP